MKTAAQLSLSFDARRANLPVVMAIVIGLSVVLGLLLTDTTEEMVAYLLVTAACAAPCALWIWVGAASVPIMPAMAAMFYLYYALPILRGTAIGVTRIGWNEMGIGPSEVLSGAVTVALFLFVATLAWGLLLAGIARRPGRAAREIVSGSQLNKLVVFGFAAGIIYYLATLIGLLTWLGANFGFVRAVLLSAATVACFLVGHARARGLVQGGRWRLAVAAIILLVGLSWLSLFLIGGVLHFLAAMAGYVITSRRVPWASMIALATIVMVLHAGKDEMRRKHWIAGKQYGAELSITQIPGMMAEWMTEGVTALTSGKEYESAIDRASLLTLLLQAQRLAPDYVPFLEGKSYVYLGSTLVPRFINENKIASQAAMILLNIHFGVQMAHQTANTSIGWGLVAEAYANFGRVGVVGIALLLGLFSGLVERWSDGAPLASFPSLLAFAVLMQLINVEMDAVTLSTTLFQTIVSVSILLWFFGALSRHREASLVPR